MAEGDKIEEYSVNNECIACDACCDDFPDIFKMNDDHTLAIAYAPSEVGKFNPWNIINICPVDAISLIKGELPPPPEGTEEVDKKETEVTAPSDNRLWQVRWAEVKDQPESEWERMKRYGLAYTIEESLDKIHVSFAMPSIVPHHQLKFRWGLPDTMPDYKIDVQLDKQTLKVYAKLEDKNVQKLCDIASSFPDRFLREFKLSSPGKSIIHNYNPADKTLDIVIEKESSEKTS